MLEICSHEKKAKTSQKKETLAQTPAPVQPSKTAKGHSPQLILSFDEDNSGTLHCNFVSEIPNDLEGPLEYDSEEYLSDEIPYEMKYHDICIYGDDWTEDDECQFHIDWEKEEAWLYLAENLPPIQVQIYKPSSAPKQAIPT